MSASSDKDASHLNFYEFRNFGRNDLRDELKKYPEGFECFVCLWMRCEQRMGCEQRMRYEGSGYERMSCERMGYVRSGYERSGYEWLGYVRSGYEWLGCETSVLRE